MIKRSKIFLFIFFISFVYITSGFSQVTMYGGRGLMRLLSANVITPADIYVNGYFSMYFEKTGPEQLAKFYSVNLNATVGLSRYLELSCHLVPYQDDQEHILGRMGDTQFAIKYLLPFSSTKVQMGLQGFLKLPTAQVPAIPYEVFYTDKSAWGGRALFTFNFSKTSSLFPFKIYSNIGYFDHDIHDTFFSSQVDQMLLGLGIKLPIRSTQVYFEYTGEIFINNMDSVAYNENSNRITSGIKLLGPWGSAIDIVGDISLTKRSPLSKSSIFHKEYTKWRFWVGLTYRFSLYKYFDKSAKLAKQKREQELKKLEKIKRKRKKASKDMDKMKEILKEKNPENL